MAIELQEYIGSLPVNKNSNKIDCKECAVEDINPMAEDSIMQEIEGLHVGPTRNFTWYMEESLDSSIPSWTRPYQKPLIMHHNETDGKIIGRVVSAEKKTKNTRSGTPALLFTCNVPDKEGKEQILDGRLKTVSVGVTAHDIRCSICGKQIELDEDGYSICGHDRGQAYDGKICYWEVYKMEAKELSYVIVPSDIYAHNVRTYKVQNKKQMGLSESLEEREIIKMEDNLKNVDVQEKANIDEKVAPDKKPEEVASEGETKAATEKSIVEEKDKEIAELKAQITKLNEEKDAVAKSLVRVQGDLDAALDKVKATEGLLQQETQLKESAENSLIETKAQLRESMEDSLNSLRMALNKPVVLKESLSTRTVESIKDSILDLKEEMQGFNNVKNITHIEDTTLKREENDKINSLNVKESNSESNINVEETARDLLAKMLL